MTEYTRNEETTYEEALRRINETVEDRVVSERVLFFKRPEDLYHYIVDGFGHDVYNQEKNKYLFPYNENGDICVYDVTHKDAVFLEMERAKLNDTDWAGLLPSTGGEICERNDGEDNPVRLLCEELYRSRGWVNGKDIVEEIRGLMDTAEEMIEEFCQKEYEEDKVDFSDYSNIHIAYTTVGNEKHEVQAVLDLSNCEIRKYKDQKLVSTEKYDSLYSFVNDAVANLEFEDLVYLDEPEGDIGL